MRGRGEGCRQTVFLSSHILSEVEALCDRVAILRSGHLVEAGTLAEMRHLSAAATGAGLGFATLLAAGVNVVPAGIFVLGLGTLVHGVAPRYAAAAAYGLVAWSFLVGIVGANLGVSHWLPDLSILHHIARAPAAPIRWDMAAILTAIGIAAAIAGAGDSRPPHPAPPRDPCRCAARVPWARCWRAAASGCCGSPLGGTGPQVRLEQTPAGAPAERAR